MAQVRLYDGFDEADPIAFGLPAAELLVVVACAIASLLLIRSPWPRFLALPPAVAIGGAGAALGWIRWNNQTLLQWAVKAARFYTERGTLLLASDSTSGDDAPPAPGTPAVGSPVSPEPPRHRRENVADETTANSNDAWRRWLEPAAEPAANESSSDAEPQVLTVMDTQAPALSDLGDEGDDELPLGELEIDDDEPETDLRGIILPFTRASADDVDGDALEGAHTAIADEISLDAKPMPTAFVGAPRRITFFSLNGGTGKTTLCTEVAALLASRGEHTPNGVHKQRLRVAVIDLDLRSASVSVRLGIPQPTIWDYAHAPETESKRLDDYLVSHSSGLNALLGPPKPVPSSSNAIDPERVADIVADLEANGYHYIFFDVSSDLNPTTSWVLNSVHDIFIVMTANASGIQDAYRTAALLRRMGLRHKLSYVVNRTRSHLDVGPTMSDLGGKLVAEIPYDSHVEDAENSHQLVIEQKTPAADAITRLAATIYPGLAPQERKARLPLPWRRKQAR